MLVTRFRVLVPFVVLSCVVQVWAASSASSRKVDWVSYAPLLPADANWQFNDCWLGRTIGPKEFYMADHGAYMRIRNDAVAMLKQVGLYDRVIPGYIDPQFLKYFLTEERAHLKNQAMKKMFERILANKWPILTLFSCRFRGLPPPSDRIIRIIEDQWIGDGIPETVYRLEPVFHYIKTKAIWRGSSMYLWDKKAASKFFGEELMPKVQTVLPFAMDPNHQWSRSELRKLCDIYCEEFCRPAKRTIVYGSMLSCYHLASLPGNITFGDKGADAFASARVRGMMRQFGGNKFYLVWLGHEPTEKYGYFDDSRFSIGRDDWGFPLPYVRYYVYRPYLIGANYYVNEKMPHSCIQDIEGDGQFELSTLGNVVKDMLDFVDRHPKRGIVYSPIAIMLDYNRTFSYVGTSYPGYNIQNDDPDHMSAGIFEMLFPEPPHAVGASSWRGPGYFSAAPFGEIFDILQPNLPRRGVDLKALENYKILFALGGMTFDANFSALVKQYVSRGGTLVLNVADATEYLGSGFLGFDLAQEGKTMQGGQIRCTICGKKIDEGSYSLHKVTLSSAKPVFVDSNGAPVVTKNKYGKGYVITLLPHYCVESTLTSAVSSRGIRFAKKSLLKFMEHFFEHLVSRVMPVEVRLNPEYRPHTSWIVAKKDDGWLVTLFDYSLEKELVVAHNVGTGKLPVHYPYKKVPFEILCRAPVKDVIEWYQDRDVNWQSTSEGALVSEAIGAGDILVYEFQPHRIDLGKRTRYVNYAEKANVRASSFQEGYEPWRAFDGKTDRTSYWWSMPGGKNNTFDLPQWIECDLGSVKTIDRIFVLFYVPQDRRLQTRLHINKYIVAASRDRLTWETLIDESKNEDVANEYGLERWFEPTKARYVRLTVFRNSALSGAQVIEMKVMGDEKESYEVARRPAPEQ